MHLKLQHQTPFDLNPGIFLDFPEEHHEPHWQLLEIAACMHLLAEHHSVVGRNCAILHDDMGRVCCGLPRKLILVVIRSNSKHVCNFPNIMVLLDHLIN